VGNRLGGPQVSKPGITTQQPPARLWPRARVVHHRISSPSQGRLRQSEALGHALTRTEAVTRARKLGLVP
jgi:hypothetical protein